MSGEDTGRVPSGPGSREPSPAVSAASGFDPSRNAASAKLTSYPEARVLALAEEAFNLGILCHIDGFPFGRAS